MNRMRTLWRTRRREVILAGAFLLLVFVSLAVNYGSIGRNAAQLAGGVPSFRKELLAKQQAFAAATAEEHRLQQPMARLAGARQKFWQPVDGNPQNELRRRIEQCAKGANLRLKSIGTVQNVKLAEGLNVYEISVTADAQLSDLVAFMQKVEQERPHIFWKNLTISPDNTRSPNFLMLNGTVKILVLNEPEIAQKLWGGE